MNLLLLREYHVEHRNNSPNKVALSLSCARSSLPPYQSENTDYKNSQCFCNLCVKPDTEIFYEIAIFVP